MAVKFQDDRNINELEKSKFCKDSNDDIAVRGCNEVSGTVIAGGFKIEQKITTANVTATSGAIPSGGNLSLRNAISIQNLSEIDTVYIGNSDVVAGRGLGTTAGWEIGPLESLNETVTDAITYYAVADTGKTVLVKIREIA